MSGDLAAYMVDLERLRAVLGSGDTTLEQDIVARCFTTVRFYFIGWAGGRIGDGGPTLTDAVTALIHGGPFDDRFAYQYAYALEPICAAVGEELDNSLWCEISDVVFEEVDDFFHRAGAFVRTDELCFERRLPIELPGAPGEPDIGFRGRDEIPDIAIMLETACTEAEGSDEWFVENARAVRDWFARAAEAGLDLVFFGS